MKIKKRKATGREVDEAAIKRLEELRAKVHADNASAARNAASNLSWLQEDGYEILKEALLEGSSRAARIAAAYGLRKMRGRMKKEALELLEQGRKSRKKEVRNVCTRALELMAQRKQSEPSVPPGQELDGQPRKKQQKKKSRPVLSRDRGPGRGSDRGLGRGPGRNSGRGRGR